MPTDVIMPALGMAQDTGVVVTWKKQAGDRVTKGEPLLEIETDKAVVDVESPATGTLASISAEPGAEVAVGTTIAVILGEGESAASSPRAGKGSSPQIGKGSSPQVGEVARSAGGADHRLQPASPLARRLAAERGLDLATVTGAGPEGSVQAADLPAVVDHSELEVSRTWRIMAERTAAAWEAPHFYLTREAMAERLVGEKRDKVTVTDVLVRLSALT